MRVIFGVFIATLIFYQNQAKRDFTVELYEIKVNVTDPVILKFENHTIYDLKTFSIEFLVDRPVTNLIVNIKLDMMKKDNRPINLFKVSVKNCEGFISNKVHYMRVILQQFRRISNLPFKNCVLLANKLYYIRNYTLVDDDYPSFYPAMTWRFTFEFATGEHTVSTTSLTGRVRKL